jgi:hypothetical protein
VKAVADARLQRLRRRFQGRLVCPAHASLPARGWHARVVAVAVRGGEGCLGLPGDEGRPGWLARLFRVVNPNAEAVP